MKGNRLTAAVIVIVAFLLIGVIFGLGYALAGLFTLTVYLYGSLANARSIRSPG